MNLFSICLNKNVTQRKRAKREHELKTFQEYFVNSSVPIVYSDKERLHEIGIFTVISFSY